MKQLRIWMLSRIIDPRGPITASSTGNPDGIPGEK